MSDIWYKWQPGMVVWPFIVMVASVRVVVVVVNLVVI